LTAAKWCKKNGLSIYALRYHIHKFNKEKKQNSKETQWASVIPATSEVNAKTSKPLIKSLI
jgi:hypothetical protein